MEVNLICSENLRKLLVEMLSNRNISINEHSNVCIIEKGFDLDKAKIGVYFDLESLNALVEYLDGISFRDCEPQNLITGKSENGEYKILAHEEILYFEAIGKDIFCITKGKKYIMKEKLYDLESKLGKKGFIRVNKSIIINIKGIDRIIPWFNSTLILKMEGIGTEVIVTRNYMNEFKKFLDI